MQALQERDISAQRTALGIERSPKWSAVSATESNNRYDLHRERLPTFPRTNGICMGNECRLINRHFTTLKSYVTERDRKHKGVTLPRYDTKGISVRH